MEARKKFPTLNITPTVGDVVLQQGGQLGEVEKESQQLPSQAAAAAVS